VQSRIFHRLLPCLSCKKLVTIDALLSYTGITSLSEYRPNQSYRRENGHIRFLHTARYKAYTHVCTIAYTRIVDIYSALDMSNKYYLLTYLDTDRDIPYAVLASVYRHTNRDTTIDDSIQDVHVCTKS